MLPAEPVPSDHSQTIAREGVRSFLGLDTCSRQFRSELPAGAVCLARQRRPSHNYEVLVLSWSEPRAVLCHCFQYRSPSARKAQLPAASEPHVAPA